MGSDHLHATAQMFDSFLLESFPIDADMQETSEPCRPTAHEHMEVEENKAPVVNQCIMGLSAQFFFFPLPGKSALRISPLYVLSEAVPKR